VIIVTIKIFTSYQFYINKNCKMKIEQIYAGCLAQGAYYIESNVLKRKVLPWLYLNKILKGIMMAI